MDRRQFLKDLFKTAAATAVFGLLPDGSAQAALYKAPTDEAWMGMMLGIALKDVPEAYDNACAKYLPAFRAAEKAIGFKVEDQMAFAFIETRIGKKSKNNIFQNNDDPTFINKFGGYMGPLLPAIKAYDPKLGARVKEVLARMKKGDPCASEILALRPDPLISALFTGCRIQQGREIVAEKVGEAKIEPYIGKGFGYLVHNLGEPRLARILANLAKPATRILPANDIRARAMSSSVQAQALIKRIAGHYVNVRTAILEHAHEVSAHRAVRPSPNAKPSAKPASLKK